MMLLAIATLAAGCVNIFWTTTIRPVDRLSGRAAAYDIRTPVKAHLTDGGTIVFSSGVQVNARELIGSGDRYPLLSSQATPSRGVTLDSVVGIETFEGKKLVAKSVVVSTAATLVGAAPTPGPDRFCRRRGSRMRSHRCSSSGTSTRCA